MRASKLREHAWYALWRLGMMWCSVCHDRVMVAREAQE